MQSLNLKGVFVRLLKVIVLFDGNEQASSRVVLIFNFLDMFESEGGRAQSVWLKNAMKLG